MEPLKTMKSTIFLKNEWTTESPLPTPRLGLKAVAVDDSIYVIGGKTWYVRCRSDRDISSIKTTMKFYQFKRAY